MKQVKAVCSSCYGTGLYSGMCEAKGEAVICLTCGGTGCEYLRYQPFTQRLKKKGIEKVSWSAGRFLIGPMGATGNSITYKEFAAGKFPPRPRSLIIECGAEVGKTREGK